MVASRSGHANIEVDGVGYHSPYDPAEEARRFYVGLPLGEADVVIHFGWGLGYAGPVLAERIRDDARVLVVEPDPEVFDLYRSGVGMNGGAPAPLVDSRFSFVDGSETSRFLDAVDAYRQETDRFLWIDWPRAVRRTPDLSSALHAAFDRRLRDRAANLLTHFQNGWSYFENAVANLHHSGDPVVGRLSGRFRNVPLVLVAAGPSLDRNIRDLRGMESRCFILAVDTALRPLLEAGVVPQMVVTADPSALNARHVVGALPPSTFLAAEQGVHPRAMAAAVRRFQFSVRVFPDSLYAEFGLERSSLNVWGSVATAALDLALKTGADPIIFAGQDCAYSWDRAYARHTIFEDRDFDPGGGGTSAPDLFGRPVQTTENLLAYRDSLLRQVSAERRRRFINATEGGILHGPGIEVLTLRDALLKSCTSRVDVGSRLARLHRRQAPPGGMAAHLAHVLEERNRACGCLDGYLELVAKEALLQDDADGVDAAIRRGIEIAAGVDERKAVGFAPESPERRRSDASDASTSENSASPGVVHGP